jgi:hypothetical protein
LKKTVPIFTQSVASATHTTTAMKIAYIVTR